MVYKVSMSLLSLAVPFALDPKSNACFTRSSLAIRTILSLLFWI